MEIEIDEKIFQICKRHIKVFKSECLDADYAYFRDKNQDEWNIMYIQACLLETKNMIKLKNKLVSGGINQKYINELFYKVLKFNFKHERGLFSFNEIIEWDIEPDMIKSTTTKYTLI